MKPAERAAAGRGTTTATTGAGVIAAWRQHEPVWVVSRRSDGTPIPGTGEWMCGRCGGRLAGGAGRVSAHAGGPMTLRYRPTTERLVAVDPALRDAGVAWGTGDVLAGAVTVRNPHGSASRVAGRLREYILLDDLVVEKPRLYSGKTKYSSGVEALDEVLGLLPKPRKAWTPSQWKGNVPKPIHHRRVAAWLREHQPAALFGIENDHNAWDAAALWLFARGLIRRGAV